LGIESGSDAYWESWEFWVAVVGHGIGTDIEDMNLRGSCQLTLSAAWLVEPDSLRGGKKQS
jgi:hypothetical protein